MADVLAQGEHAPEHEETKGPFIASPGYLEPPVPYEERQCKSDPKWCRDYYDDAIPSSKGFITDMVFHSRGYETPTLSVIWTALFVLSSAIKREAWVKWVPKHLFTNQYIIIVGPAGVVKKTTAVTDIGHPVLKEFRSYIQDPQLAEMKRIHFVKDKITPEAMLSSMLPENKEGTGFHFKDPQTGEFLVDQATGKTIRYEKTSEAAIVISELSIFLSKASYQETMVQILLDLYDCRDEWEWATKGGGKLRLRNLHTGLLGATTVDGLRSSIPPSAKGDGFLSRTVLVHVPDTRRVYRRPFIPYHAPSTQELAKRLAWIAEHTLGEYDFSPEAEALAEEWYQFFAKKKRQNAAYTAAWSRMDVNVYKTALLMRAQRYDDSDRLISVEDLRNAIRLLDLTYSSFPFLMSQISSDDFTVATSSLASFIRKRRKTTRQKALIGTRIRSDIATWAFNELMQRGEVRATYEGRVLQEATSRAGEIYEWTGGDNGEGFDGDGEAGGTGEREGFNYSGAFFVDPPDGFEAGGEPHGPEAVHEKGGDREGGEAAPKRGGAAKARKGKA